MKQWILQTKRADFAGLAARLGVDPVLVRLMRNRDLLDYASMHMWLNGDITFLHDPHLLKDADKAAERILYHINKKSKIMVANDFDCDGISGGFILENCLRELGGDVYVDTPDRIADGYGINERMVLDAAENGVNLIITCDNGIAAMAAAEACRDCNIELIITDHHEVPFVMEGDVKRYILPPAFAVVDPKQEDCPYPFKGICGAVVAFKLMQIVFEMAGKAGRKGSLGPMAAYLEIAAMATVADVMELKDENRVIVKQGLLKMRDTDNLGLRSLMEANSVDPSKLNAYTIGFVIGPCLNASGRLSSAKKALALLNEKDPAMAKDMAMELKNLNDARKDMTVKGVEKAKEIVEAGMLSDKVLVVKLDDCHESLAGIIAGKVREAYNRPTIVFVDTGEGLKGSGRSIKAYDMYTKVNEHKDMTSRFGGHAMACGLSMDYDKLDAFRAALNRDCGLTEKDLIERVDIDMRLPLSYLSERLIKYLELLAPFGNGNPHPMFAESGLYVRQARILGQNRNVLKLRVADEKGCQLDAITFNGLEEFETMIRTRYGEETLMDMYAGKRTDAKILLAYEPSINEFRGLKSIQLTIKHMDVPKA